MPSQAIYCLHLLCGSRSLVMFSVAIHQSRATVAKNETPNGTMRYSKKLGEQRGSPGFRIGQVMLRTDRYQDGPFEPPLTWSAHPSVKLEGKVQTAEVSPSSWVITFSKQGQSRQNLLSDTIQRAEVYYAPEPFTVWFWHEEPRPLPVSTRLNPSHHYHEESLL